MKTLWVTVQDEDLGRADRLARQLRLELQALDLDRAEYVMDNDVPSSAKGGAASVTAIVIALSSSPVLVQLVGLLRDWVNRASGRKITIRDGDRSLELIGTTEDNNDEAIDSFFRSYIGRPENASESSTS